MSEPMTHHSEPAREALALPVLPDNDADFTPDLARKIIAGYQRLLLLASPAPAAGGLEAVREETNTPQREAFWRWLPLAYRNGHEGEDAKFTKYNMEVAHLAGWEAALSPAATSDEVENDNRLRAALRPFANMLPDTQEAKGAVQRQLQEWCRNARTALASPAATSAVDLIRWAHDTLKEINPSNYDHDDVCALNAASVEVILGLASALGETHGKTAEWWANWRRNNAPAATSAETQGGDGVREAIRKLIEGGKLSCWLDEDEHVETFELIRAALAPSNSAATRGEPVAWRWRAKDRLNDDWSTTARKPAPADFLSCEIEPLYAAARAAR